MKEFKEIVNEKDKETPVDQNDVIKQLANIDFAIDILEYAVLKRSNADDKTKKSTKKLLDSIRQSADKVFSITKKLDIK